jgi:hypothetical protein
MTIGIMRSFLTLGKKAFIGDISRSFHVWLSPAMRPFTEPSFARCTPAINFPRYTPPNAGRNEISEPTPSEKNNSF